MDAPTQKLCVVCGLPAPAEGPCDIEACPNFRQPVEDPVAYAQRRAREDDERALALQISRENIPR